MSRHDPHVPVVEPLDAALEEADAVVVATNHSEFDRLLERLPADVLLVDPWNTTGSAGVRPGERAGERGMSRVLVTGGRHDRRGGCAPASP